MVDEVREGLSFDCPTNAKQGSEDLTGSGCRPLTHADTANTSLSYGGTLS